MCKITFSHIIEENSLRKGIFQLDGDLETNINLVQEPSTDNSEENFS